ncbi:MAG: hypothetical protein CMK86_13860 [Pseudomonadales bacterium]|nr:hypothetical protein [Pseudomonas sp.]MBB51358.1 hypothetical protein [Pseudomonadales bacterium]MBF78952.1 hypothetical protein [Pseudomonadales bacterium]|tara:strand:- start:6746 stop:8089 length:1344 start_codon:yes stop_codon:yes gene_type:complete
MTNLSGTNLNNGSAVGPQGEGRDSPSTFPKYPAYKDSGVEWLGEVPDHWESRRLKFLFSLQKRPVVDGDGIVTCFRDGAVTLRSNRRTDGFTNAEKEIGYQGIRKGDLVIHAMDAFAGAIGVSDSDGKSSPVYSACTPNEGVSAYYFARLLRHMALAGFVSSLAKGIRERSTDFRWSDASEICLPLPSISEQTQIARFLDHETARIDALIEEQQRLIELLKEKRRGIVLSALSDTSLPLVRIGHAVDVISRPVKQREDESYTPIGLFNRDRGLFHKEPREMQDMGDSDFFWIKSGDLIISGQFAWEGAVAMAGESEEGLVVSHRYPVLRGKHGVANTEYLYAILTTKHGDFLLNESSRGAAGRNRPLNLAALLKEKIRIPSKEIQEQVSNLVQNEAKVLTECRQQISLLQERRSALISAAVTGKIDVRGWQPAAHSQAPESAVAEAH